MVDGTYCVEGNAVVGGNTGTELLPRNMSIIATGSIEISGNPYLNAEHEEGILLLAGGDISISGNPGLSKNFVGVVYSGSQCKISGNPTLDGLVVCNANPNPPGSINFTDENLISGNPVITYDCSANALNKRRVLSWYPRIGL